MAHSIQSRCCISIRNEPPRSNYTGLSAHEWYDISWATWVVTQLKRNRHLFSAVPRTVIQNWKPVCGVPILLPVITCHWLECLISAYWKVFCPKMWRVCRCTTELDVVSFSHKKREGRWSHDSTWTWRNIPSMSADMNLEVWSVLTKWWCGRYRSRSEQLSTWWQLWPLLPSPWLSRR